MRVAAVGAGIGGVMAVVHWARAGHQGALVESRGDILQAAFHASQYRLHGGFHYAQSPKTIRQCLQAERPFRKEYGQAVVDDGLPIYAIEQKKFRTAPERFLQALQEHGLEFEDWSDPDICADAVAAVFRGQEGRFGYARLKPICVDRIRPSGVALRLNRPFVCQEDAWFGQVVIATHAGIHSVSWDGHEPLQSQFEVCEKTMVRLSRSARKKSIVVLDGPFMCVNPLGRSERYVRGNVVYAIHSANVGNHTGVPPPIAPLWNRGILPPPPRSRFQRFIDAGLLFVSALREASWVGSMFSVRAVLPDVDGADERPTFVTRLTHRHIRVLSGKFVSCADAAFRFVSLVNEAK